MSEHVSFSQFTTFSRCGKQYQLERIQGVPRTPSLALLFGSAVHEAFERVLKNEVDSIAGSVQSMWGDIVESHAQRMIKEFDTPIEQFKVSGRKTEAKPNREDYDWWMVEGLQQVNAFLDWLGYKRLEHVRSRRPDTDGRVQCERHPRRHRSESVHRQRHGQPRR